MGDGEGGATSLFLKVSPIPSLWLRHCISSPGFSSGSQATPDEEELLSPEACYECKINGLSPQDRPRRSTHGDHQVQWGPHWEGQLRSLWVSEGDCDPSRENTSSRNVA